MTQQPSNLRWGELEDEDGEEDLTFLLPPKQVIGPDKNGIKKVIEYKIKEDGTKVKITTNIQVRKIVVNKRVVERRLWAKFGDAAPVNKGAGDRGVVDDSLTMVSTEEIVLERPRAPGSKTAGGEALGDGLGKGGEIKLCRTCGKKGDHWTAHCPNKDLAPQDPEPFTDHKRPTSGHGKYVPPNKNASGDMRRRNDDNSVRVSNLSEDTQEADLHELFRPFGPVTRAHVVRDKTTSVSRGFGFVEFVSRDDAQRAINKLDGYGYDNLILRVEWAPPKAK
ncbi:hypothetical protein ACFX15_028521 [Malus domestica]|uniref:Eukaryotic translation initiation factor 3 subunit G n=1 Tax=Malus domestica TaxID=3750 RepID=A0A498K6Y9_MALDO|nr:hypothetical protein DVH24_038323 [Malus domestica]